MSITLIITYNQKENINYRKEVKLRYDMGLVLFVCFLNFCAFRLKTTYNPLHAHNLDRMARLIWRPGLVVYNKRVQRANFDDTVPCGCLLEKAQLRCNAVRSTTQIKKKFLDTKNFSWWEVIRMNYANK